MKANISKGATGLKRNKKQEEKNRNMKMLNEKFNNNEIALKDYMYGMVTNIYCAIDGWLWTVTIFLYFCN